VWGGAFGVAGYFNGAVYFQANNNPLYRYVVSQGRLSAKPVSIGPRILGAPGASPVISAKGTNNGIVWTLGTYPSKTSPAKLFANRADNVSLQLYGSDQSGARDTAGLALPYTVPVVASGKVFFGTIGGVEVYGLLTNKLSETAIVPAGGTFSGPQSVTLLVGTDGAEIRYTTDGTEPTDTSALYTGPILVNRTMTIVARKFAPGKVPSKSVRADFALLNVVMRRYDHSQTGANTNETILTPANVGPATFGKLFRFDVDGEVYAQPLILNGVDIPGKGVRNVTYVATEHNSVYAFDVDNLGNAVGEPLWKTSFLNEAAGIVPVTPADVGNQAISPEIGITGTPVIEPSSKTLYVVAKTKEPGFVFANRLHALDVTTGLEKPGSPVLIDGLVDGVGADSKGGKLRFSQWRQMNRAGLTIVTNQTHPKGIVYVAFTSHNGTQHYHGWVFGFDPQTLETIHTFCTTPNAESGSVWMAGAAPCSDDAGNLYMMTGNGPYNPLFGSYGDSMLKFGTDGPDLVLADHFTPFNQLDLEINDLDLGSGGAMLLPDIVGSPAHRRLMVGAGKLGTIYLVDRDNMGRFKVGDNQQIVQELTRVLGDQFGAVWGAPAYFNGSIYYHANDDFLRQYSVTNARLSLLPVSSGRRFFGYPGAIPSVSANGTRDGIVWTVKTFQSGKAAAVLVANRADNLGVELYGSDSVADGRDAAGVAVRFVSPVIFNGRVYVETVKGVDVYGLRSTRVADPVFSPPPGTFTDTVAVKISTGTGGAEIHYTLDGSAPVVTSPLLNGPISVGQTATVSARAFKAGLVASGIAKANYIISRQNVPPVVGMVKPVAGAVITGPASVTLEANAVDSDGVVTNVVFYSQGLAVGSATTAPYSITLTGLAPGMYAVSAIAYDDKGAGGGALPVSFTVATNGASPPFGLGQRVLTQPFLGLPHNPDTPMPVHLSEAGLFVETSQMSFRPEAIPYQVNHPFWSDRALKRRWFTLPFSGGVAKPAQQIAMGADGGMVFPEGTVFVKHFDLLTNELDTNAIRRLETRLLVVQTNGLVFGGTYKWRADLTDADFVTNSLLEDIAITTATGVRTQSWFYPGFRDCLVCHTPVSGGILGAGNTRQMNGDQLYPSTGITDNQLRAYNSLGMLYPAIDEQAIGSMERLGAIGDSNHFTLEWRARSFLDANCSYCHRPGGLGHVSFDARITTPLANAGIINGPVAGSLPDTYAIKPGDQLHSGMLQRILSLDPLSKMPPIGRNEVDTEAANLLSDWIDSLVGVPPTLSIKSDAQGLVLTWDNGTNRFYLEQSSSAGANQAWTPVPMGHGTNRHSMVRIATTNVVQRYRLSSQNSAN
jgi:hypothetical protein